MDCDDPRDSDNDESTSSSDIEDDDSGSDVGHVSEKRVRRREQNRKAAQRCRARKREDADTVVQEYKQYLSANTGVKHEIRKLEKEKKLLENLLHQHKSDPNCAMKQTSRQLTVIPNLYPNVLKNSSCFKVPPVLSGRHRGKHADGKRRIVDKGYQGQISRNSPTSRGMLLHHESPDSIELISKNDCHQHVTTSNGRVDKQTPTLRGTPLPHPSQHGVQLSQPRITANTFPREKTLAHRMHLFKNSPTATVTRHEVTDEDVEVCCMPNDDTTSEMSDLSKSSSGRHSTQVIPTVVADVDDEEDASKPVNTSKRKRTSTSESKRPEKTNYRKKVKSVSKKSSRNWSVDFNELDSSDKATKSLDLSKSCLEPTFENTPQPQTQHQNVPSYPLKQTVERQHNLSSVDQHDAFVSSLFQTPTTQDVTSTHYTELASNMPNSTNTGSYVQPIHSAHGSDQRTRDIIQGNLVSVQTDLLGRSNTIEPFSEIPPYEHHTTIAEPYPYVTHTTTNTTPYISHSTPYISHSTPYRSHSIPYTRHSIPYTSPSILGSAQVTMDHLTNVPPSFGLGNIVSLSMDVANGDHEQL